MHRKQAFLPTEPHKERCAGSSEPQRIQEVLFAIAGANEQWLPVLRQRAFREDSTFPLPSVVRRRLIEMTDGQLREVAQCGILLAEARFLDVEHWRSIAHRGPVQPNSHDEDKVAGKHAVSVAYSLFAVVWYVVQTAPSAAGVLMGMSADVVEEFKSLRVGQLARVARCYASCIQPRWRDRADVWMGVLQPQGPEEGRRRSVILQCLKAASERSPGLLPFIAVRP